MSGEDRWSVDVDAITNATMGSTGAYIAQEDSNVIQDFGNISK